MDDVRLRMGLVRQAFLKHTSCDSKRDAVFLTGNAMHKLAIYHQ